jgi:hypothetical protein
MVKFSVGPNIEPATKGLGGFESHPKSNQPNMVEYNDIIQRMNDEELTFDMVVPMKGMIEIDEGSPNRGINDLGVISLTTKHQ